MKWMTRARPKIDRIACPWPITRFIDDAPEFLHVAAPDVLRLADETGAVRYDVPDVELGHHGEHCSFDAFLARIVRGATTGRLDLAPEATGLYAISIGLSTNFADDHEQLRQGIVIYDALYAWCRRDARA